MKNPSRACTVIFFLCALPLNAQISSDTLRFLLRLSTNARFATADNLGNIYLLTSANELEKYNPGGALLARYSNNRHGMAAFADVSNPLKILLWYADFRNAVFLDRNLTALGELNLVAAGFPDTRTLAAAADGNIWLYDETAFRLRKITPAGEPLFESQNLGVLLGNRFSISCLRDNGSEVLAADSLAGILQFDAYGQWLTTLPRKGISDFVLENDRLVYRSGPALHVERLRAFDTRTIPLPAPALAPEATVWLAPGRLFVQKENVVEVWAW